MSGKTELSSKLSQFELPSLERPTKLLIAEFSDKLIGVVNQKLPKKEAEILADEIMTLKKRRLIPTCDLSTLSKDLIGVAFRCVESFEKGNAQPSSSETKQSSPTKEEVVTPDDQEIVTEMEVQEELPTNTEEKKWAQELASRLLETNEKFPLDSKLVKEAENILFTENETAEFYTDFANRAKEELKKVGPPSQEQVQEAEQALQSLVSKQQKLKNQDEKTKSTIETLKQDFEKAKKTAKLLTEFVPLIVEANKLVEGKLDLQAAEPVYEKAYLVVKEFLTLIEKYEKQTSDQERYVNLKKVASESLTKEKKGLQDANRLFSDATRARDTLLAIFDLLEAQGLAKSYLNLKDPNFDANFSKTAESIQGMKLDLAKDNLSTVKGFIQQAPQMILQVMQNKISPLQVELSKLSNNDPLLSKKVDNTEESLRQYTRELSARITILKEIDGARNKLKSTLDEVLKLIPALEDSEHSFTEWKESAAKTLKTLDQHDLKSLQSLLLEFSDHLVFLRNLNDAPKPQKLKEEPVVESTKQEVSLEKQKAPQETVTVQPKEKLSPTKKAENTWHFIEPLNKQIASLQSEVLQLTILADRLKNDEKEEAIAFINQLQNDLAQKLDQIKAFKEKFSPKK